MRDIKDYLDSKETLLENGVTILTVKKDTDIFSFQTGIKVGSMNESEEEKGLSHFVEHMIFKGTETRTNNDINREIEELGGNFLAYTTYSETIYGVTALSEEIEKSIDIVSDLIINPIFLKSEFSKEKSVIISEIKSSLDDLESYSYSKIHNNAFDKSFLKWDIAGSIEKVEEYTLEDLWNFYSKHYIPSNIYISVVSKYDHEYILSMINEYYRDWEVNYKEEHKIVDEKNKNIRKIDFKKDIEQSTLIYMYSFYDITKREELALEILNYALGESPNSILFKRLREELGITYDIYSEINSNPHVKLLTIYMSTDNENLEIAEKEVNKVINEIKNDKIIENRNINIMKKVIKTTVAETFNDPESLCTYVMGQILFNKDIYEFHKDIEILEEIDKNDIVKIGKKVLNNKTMQIVTM